MKILVTQKDVRLRLVPLSKVYLAVIAALAIHFMLIPIVFLDITCWLYQHIYFGIFKIPKISRSEYVKMTRHTLPGLSVIQKWSCWYCEYTSGSLAWVKAVAKQTETYSCAIKYAHTYPGLEGQEGYFEQSKFQNEAQVSRVEAVKTSP